MIRKSLYALYFLLFIKVARTADVDWRKIRPRDVEPDIFRNFPSFGRKMALDARTQQERITGGQESPRHAFPHQMGLILQLEEFNSFCGGSLISDGWIVTAAHCVDGAQSATVYLGAHNIRDPNENRSEIRVGVENFIIHEGWDKIKVRNDIALIKLPVPFKLTDKVSPIKLPRKSDSENKFEGEPAVASGWGKHSDEASSISPVLRYIETEIFSLAICKVMYLFTPTDNNICISGQNGSSTCNGDSGGPLITYEADGTSILIGITSFGSNLGCEIGYPAVFTRCTSYLDWIHKHTGIPLR